MELLLRTKNINPEMLMQSRDFTTTYMNYIKFKNTLNLSFIKNKYSWQDNINLY